MPGEGKKSSQGSSLLYIAGEKIEGSGILGKRKKHRHVRCFFACAYSAQKGRWE